MVANYEIKRNALSARWGVWSSERGAAAPVENLLAEFKSEAQAETFKERVSAGQPADAVIAEINAKPVREKSDGGLFGKFFKRGPKPEVTVTPQTNNPVIQIQAVQKVEAESPSAERDTISLSDANGPEPVQRAPMIRYEDESPPQPAFLAQDEISPEGDGVERETRSERDEQSESAPISDAEPSTGAAVSGESQAVPTQTSSEQDRPNTPSEPDLKMVSHVETEAPSQSASQAPASEVAEVERQQPGAQSDETRRQGMVNWTFTPPPDVSAADVQSGAAPGAQTPGDPAPTSVMDVREVHGTKIAVESSRFEALRNDSAGGEEISDKKYNSIASKEYTEVSKAYASGNSQGTLHDELLHLATVCMAWADAIEKRMASGTSQRAA